MSTRIRRWRLIVLLGGVLLLLGLVWMAVPGEPSYQGRTLHDWAIHSDELGREEALQVLGTNHLGLLVRRLGYDEDKDVFVSLYTHLPDRLKTRWLHRLFARRSRNSFDAEIVLVCLGRRAAPVVPQLLQITQKGDGVSARRAILVLSSMGGPGQPALISLVGHTNQVLAMAALLDLSGRTEVPRVRAALTNALHDPRPTIRQIAEDLLAGRGPK